MTSAVRAFALVASALLAPALRAPATLAAQGGPAASAPAVIVLTRARVLDPVGGVRPGLAQVVVRGRAIERVDDDGTLDMSRASCTRIRSTSPASHTTSSADSAGGTKRS